jgi:hypothetical protein
MYPSRVGRRKMTSMSNLNSSKALYYLMFTARIPLLSNMKKCIMRASSQARIMAQSSAATLN